jgi:uncharacterized phiE125 gp8 family phage protein
MIVERLNPPSTLPFDPVKLAAHCRVDGAPGQAEVTDHGKVAAAELEKVAGLALFDQTIRVTLEAWTRAATLPLPVVPLLDVLSVTVKVDGQAFDGFAVVTGQRPTLRLTKALPEGVVVIEYVAGHGDTLAELPADLVHAVMDQASAYYDTRGIGDAKSNGMSPHMARIAARYRRVSV